MLRRREDPANCYSPSPNLMTGWRGGIAAGSSESDVCSSKGGFNSSAHKVRSSEDETYRSVEDVEQEMTFVALRGTSVAQK